MENPEAEPRQYIWNKWYFKSVEERWAEYSVMKLRLHASPWKNKMGFPARQTPNLRDSQITTIYLVHVSLGQQFRLNSPQRLFFWSWMGSFMCLLLSAIMQLISWVGTSWFKITLLTPLEVGLLSARVMESNRPHASPQQAGLFTQWPKRVPTEQVWRVS